MVLQSEKNRSNVRTYYYDEKGNCVREEWKKGAKAFAYEYSFDADNRMVQAQYFIDNRLYSQTDYDSQGDLTAVWKAYTGDKLEKTVETTYRYDSYGRKIFREEKNLGYGDRTTEQYEYNTAPRTLIFGHYEQDGNLYNGAEPIEWLILDTDGSYSLVVSKLGLDSQRYKQSGVGASWNKSDLRKWLNSNFADLAFTPQEHANIREVQLEKATGKDTVFLLSPDEAARYLSAEEDRICIPTAYALENKAEADKRTKAGWWPLRTAGSTDALVTRVNTDGSIDRNGVSVSEAGGTLRPALWIKTSAATFGPQTPNRIHYQEYLSENTFALRDPLSFTETYDNAGRMTSSQNHTFGESLYRTYDTYGQITEECSSDPTMLQTKTAENTYDKYGQLIKSKIRHEVISLDAEGEKEHTDVSFSTVTYSYDADRHMTRRVEKTDDSITVIEEWRYDKEGRLLIETAKSGQTTTKKVWTYKDDGSSSCQTSNYSSGKVTRATHEYDSHGNLLKEYADGILIRENSYVPLSQAQWQTKPAA